MSATQTNGKATVLTIDFFLADRLPPEIRKRADAKGFRPTSRLVAVKTVMGSPPDYEFDNAGSTPAEIKQYYRRLATRDGVDLDELAKRAFSEA